MEVIKVIGTVLLIAFALLATAGFVVISMLSSRISREEERRERNYLMKEHHRAMEESESGE